MLTNDSMKLMNHLVEEAWHSSYVMLLHQTGNVSYLRATQSILPASVMICSQSQKAIFEERTFE